MLASWFRGAGQRPAWCFWEGRGEGMLGQQHRGLHPSWRAKGQKEHHGGSSEGVPSFPPGMLGRATCSLGGPQNLAQNLCFGRHFVRHRSGIRSWKSVSSWFISNMQLPRIIDRDLSYVFWELPKHTALKGNLITTCNQISIANLSEHGTLALVSRLHVAHLRFGGLHSKCWLKNFYLQIHFYSLWSKDFSSGQSFPWLLAVTLAVVFHIIKQPTILNEEINNINTVVNNYMQANTEDHYPSGNSCEH